MSEGQLKKLLEQQFAVFFGQVTKHMDARIDKLDERIDGLDSKITRLQGAVDGIAARLDDMETDNGARDVQLDRHETWIQQLSDHTSLTLNRD